MGEQFAGERETIRIWLLKVLLGQAFGRWSDGVLAAIRRIMDEARKSGRANFPVDVINRRSQSTEPSNNSESGTQVCGC